jgi:hypothetical protein
MEENGTRYADSGELVEKRGITRRGALKLGAMSVFGAAVASYLPGRSRAASLYPAPCRPGQGFNCNSGALSACGGPGSGCGCATMFTGSKLSPTKSYCVDFNVCCDSLVSCYDGQSDCPPGYVCSATTCCGYPVCLPPCGAGAPPASCCLTPTGQSAGECTTCATGGNCGVGFTQCGCTGPLGASYCFTSTENTAVCAQDVYCDSVSTCSSSADCDTGWVCITANGCTGCGAGGVCAPLCTTVVTTQPKSSPRGGLTAANKRL